MSETITTLQLNAGLTLNHVATFVAVAEAGSFRAGAEKVNISQSAVSVRIQHLEHRLGVPLFHRTTRFVQLTEQGERLLAVARGILADFERIALELRSEAALERGRVIIGSMPSIAAKILPIMMAAFQARHSGVELDIFDVDSGRIINKLKSAEIDIGIVSECEPEQADFSPIFWDEFCLVVSPQIASKLSSPVELSEVAKFPLLLSSSNTTIRRDIDRWLSSQQLKVTVKHEALNTGTLIGLAEQGLGVAIIPAISLANVSLGKSVALPFAEKLGRHIGVAVASHRSPSPALSAFKSFLQERMADCARSVLSEADVWQRTL